MSPDGKRSFETEWPQLSARLRRLLARKRVPGSCHDDLVQETALRLLVMWDQVDRNRSPWPLTVTIVMNLLRDANRPRPVREVCGNIPDVIAAADVERSGIARSELARVRRAMKELTSEQRAVLLYELGMSVEGNRTKDADKMLRMRARRKLTAVLRDVSAVVALRLRRSLDDMTGFVTLRDGFIQGATCALCLVMGTAGGFVIDQGRSPALGEITVVAPGLDLSVSSSPTLGVPGTPSAVVDDAHRALRLSGGTTGHKSGQGGSPQSAPSVQGPVAIADPPALPGSGDSPVSAPVPQAPPATAGAPAPQPIGLPDDGDSPVQIPLPTGVLGASLRTGPGK